MDTHSIKFKFYLILIFYYMNIFVAKLNSSTNNDSLFDLFSGFGEVSSAKVIVDRETGRSKGYGFVEMPDDNEAFEAIEQLNEKEFEGSVIAVKKSNPREGNGRSGGNFKRRSFNNKRY